MEVADDEGEEEVVEKVATDVTGEGDVGAAVKIESEEGVASQVISDGL